MNQTELKKFIEEYQKFETRGEYFVANYAYYGLSKPKERLVEPSSQPIKQRPFLYCGRTSIKNAKIDTLLEAVKKNHENEEIITDRTKLVITDTYGNVMDKDLMWLVNSNEVYIYEIIPDDPSFDYVVTYNGKQRWREFVIERNLNGQITRLGWNELRYPDQTTRLIISQKQMIAESFIREAKKRQEALNGRVGYSNGIDATIARLLPDLSNMVAKYLFEAEGDKTNKRARMHNEEEDEDDDEEDDDEEDDDEEDDEEGGICTII